MGREHLLHAPVDRRWPGDVDDVVGAGHDPQVAVLVDVAGVRGLVVAREALQVGALEALVVLPQGRRQPGGSGSLTTMLPGLAGGQLACRRRRPSTRTS